MKTHIAFLCDKLEITKDGLFNVIGGGISCLHLSRLPGERPITLMVDVEYDPIKESGEHIIKIRVIDSDEKDKMPPKLINATFPQNQRFFDIAGDLFPVFDAYGSHSVEVAVDKQRLVSISLNITPTDP